MSLITCKNLRGGNSLKFRVKSEEVRVGGGSSSWRFGKRELGRGKRNFSFFNLHSSLSFILSRQVAVSWIVDVEGAFYSAALNSSSAALPTGVTGLIHLPDIQ